MSDQSCKTAEVEPMGAVYKQVERLEAILGRLERSSEELRSKLTSVLETPPPMPQQNDQKDQKEMAPDTNPLTMDIYRHNCRLEDFEVTLNFIIESISI